MNSLTFVNKKFKIENFTISNLTNLLVILMAVVNLLDIFLGISYPKFQIQLLFTDEWWQIFLFPFRITNQILSLTIFLYIFWIFGSQLESELGAVQYNLYIFLGYLFIILGTYFYPLDAYYVYLSVFFAIAYLYPNTEILLFFLIPIKIKWIGIFTAVFLILNSIYMALTFQTFYPILGPILGILNFLLFIVLPDFKNKKYQFRIRYIRMHNSKKAMHRCAICGITEIDDPQMDFRYCIHCQDHEYCSKHLENHEHIQ